MEDRCVCCGAVIPEGRMVCVKCEQESFCIGNKNNEAYEAVLPYI